MPRDTDIRSRRRQAPALSLADLEYEAKGWRMHGEVRGHSREYVQKRKEYLDKLLWFLRSRELAECGPHELLAFFVYLRNGHTEPGGRWGNAAERAPLAASTVRQYHTMLRAFFNHLVRTDRIDASPLATIEAPIARPDQVQPFSEEQQRALVEAARKTRYPARNVALVLFLLDTGCRASEACSLRYGDLDLDEHSCRVLGKGGKERLVCFGGETTLALWEWLRHHSREPADPLFPALAGRHTGRALTRMGLRMLIRDLGRRAGIQGVRISPHTCRHSFALNWLNAGGDSFTLQAFLGHTHPAMTSKYVNLARADLQNQHRRKRPLDQILREERKERR